MEKSNFTADKRLLVVQRIISLRQGVDFSGTLCFLLQISRSRAQVQSYGEKWVKAFELLVHNVIRARGAAWITEFSAIKGGQS